MSNKSLVSVAGSPSAQSRSSRLLAALGERLQQAGVTVHAYSIDSFDAGAVFHARVDHPSVAGFVDRVGAAGGLLLSTPVYKASYTGALKAIVDLLPYDALLGKLGFGIATARSKPHLDATAAAFSELWGFFRVSHSIPALTLLDEEIFADPEAARFDPRVEKWLDERAQAIVSALG